MYYLLIYSEIQKNYHNKIGKREKILKTETEYMKATDAVKNISN